MPIERPDPQETPQHLSLDKGYSGTPAEAAEREHRYEVHVPDKANAKKNVSASRGAGKRGAGSSKSRIHG